MKWLSEESLDTLWMDKKLKEKVLLEEYVATDWKLFKIRKQENKLCRKILDSQHLDLNLLIILIICLIERFKK